MRSSGRGPVVPFLSVKCAGCRTRAASPRDDRDPGTGREARAIGAAQGRHL